MSQRYYNEKLKQLESAVSYKYVHHKNQEVIVELLQEFKRDDMLLQVFNYRKTSVPMKPTLLHLLVQSFQEIGRHKNQSR